MTKQDYSIKPYTDNDREQVMEVWEKSVLATHDFLAQADFQEIKKLVKFIDFNAIKVYCLKQNNKVAGFIGVADQKIEMLFFSPQYIGKGLGRKLTDFAFSELKTTKVDVNEQNTKAVRFYQRAGFKVYERTDKDDQGRAYPLLRMKLETKEK